MILDIVDAVMHKHAILRCVKPGRFKILRGILQICSNSYVDENKKLKGSCSKPLCSSTKLSSDVRSTIPNHLWMQSTWPNALTLGGECIYRPPTRHYCQHLPWFRGTFCSETRGLGERTQTLASYFQLLYVGLFFVSSGFNFFLHIPTQNNPLK